MLSTLTFCSNSNWTSIGKKKKTYKIDTDQSPLIFPPRENNWVKVGQRMAQRNLILQMKAVKMCFCVDLGERILQLRKGALLYS